jgi:hypothetical protein
MHHQLDTTIDIEASPDTVWSVLTDLERYPDWNPFIVSAVGDLTVGERLTNRMQAPGGKATTFKPRVTELESGVTLEWLGRLGVPGIFDGRHRFDLEPTTAGGTRLRHSEQFSGVMVRPLRSSLDNQTLRGFELMNDALKARAEAAAAPNDEARS